MAWLTGYTYRKKGAVNATTAGAQTNYQCELIVGESSGASGEDVDCESHCLDFPNDIRFTKEDGITKHDYWIEKLEGTTPNRKATVIIEVASIPASGSVDFYMYYRKTSDSGESVGNNTFEFFDEDWLSSILSDQYGTSSYDAFGILIKTGNDTVLHFYRQGTSHMSDKGKIVKRIYTISTNSWSAASDVFIDSTYDCRDACGGIIGNNIFLFFTRYNHSSDTYVDLGYIKSTDLTGSSWGSRVALTTTANYRYNCHGEMIHISGTTYLQAWYEHNGSGNWKVKLYKTVNSGTNWSTIEIYSGTTHHCEPTIAYIENSKLIAVMGVNNGGYVKQATSSDNGETWSSVTNTNLGISTGKKIPYILYDSETGNLIVFYHDRGENKLKVSETNANTVYASASSYNTPTEIDSGFTYNGYPSIVKIASGRYFFVYSKQIASSDADIWGGGYPFLWSTTGATSVSGGAIHLDNADAILGKTAFGYNYAIVARAKANEQDIRFIMFGDTIGLNCQNRLGITNSDTTPDVFDRIDYFAAKEGTGLGGYLTASDFRNTYYKYKIKRISGQADYYQGSTHLGTITAADNLPTGSLFPKAIVWDSSQESTLDIDWVFVRKYVSPEPTWGTWQSEDDGSENTGADTGAGVDFGSVDDGNVYEDFTTFTEVDVAGDRIQKTAKHIDHRAERDETTYLYKDYGVAHFDDFVHKIKAKMVSGDAGGQSAAWLLANDLGNYKALGDGSKTFIYLRLQHNATDDQVSLIEVNSGTAYKDHNVDGFGLGDWIYAKLVKSGTSLTAYLYSDSSYSTLVDTLTLTLHADHSFRYLYGCNTYNDGSNLYITTDIENFDIGYRICADTGAGADAKASLLTFLPAEYVLDSMDSATGWQAQSGMTNITVNATTKKEGTGALNLIKSADDATDAYIEKSISSTNLTSKYVKVWLYLKDTATVNKISRAQIYLYDASNNYRAWDTTDLATGWNLIIADTSSTPDHQSGTPGNLAAITIIELDVDTNQATDTYAEGDVIADYYHYSGFDISDSGSGAESGIISKHHIEADTGSGVDALGGRSFSAVDSGIGEEAFPPVFDTHFNIVVADGTSTKDESIPSGSRYCNIYLSDIFLKVPALSTTSKTAKLELITERGNIIYSTGDLDASTAKSYSFYKFRALKGITKYRITTDENVTDAKTFEIEIRGLRTPYSLTEVGLSEDDTGSGVDTLEGLFKILCKTGSDIGSGVDISSSKDFIAHDSGSAIEASSFSNRAYISADNGSAIEALGSREFALNDIGTGIEVGERRYPPAESRGFYYAKIGSTIFRNLNKDSFRITEELNKIPSFEFEISNSAANRAAITAGITDILRIYHRSGGTNTLLFTGIINGDAIEYLSLERIRLVGYASYIDLNWRFHQHLNSEDAETVDKCFIYNGSYTDKTTAANNDTINDVTIPFSSINNAIYIGQGEQFFGMQVKYSTKGIQAANTTVIWEYSEGSSVWSPLDVLDETRQFTQDTGTYYITIPHKPSDWAKETVNSVKKFWIRARLTGGSYSTQPKLDRIKITNVDVYRVYYFDTAANTIMNEVLDGTGYSMDVTDACPSDTISIVAEYETKLRLIAGVANALTWDDSGDKKAYQWWVDTSKKVHFKQKRGSTLGDITSELTILNNVQDYFNLSNRLHFLGNYDGLNQLRAIIENTNSQDTHEIRELAVPEERYNNYIPLKEAAQKAMTYTKAPLQKIAATITTKYWIDNDFEVGDTVTLHQDRWNVDETAFQIVRADIGPRVTNLDMGISQEHLDGLKAGLQRQLDISGIRMHGSTSLLQFGPETMNYQRVDDATVYPARLKFEIPSDARYIHKILISWKLGNYRADVTGGSESSGHSHTGHAGGGGAQGGGYTGGGGAQGGGYTGAGGAFTPDVLNGGAHTPIALAAGAHNHSVDLDTNIVLTRRDGYLPDSKTVSTSSSHTHTNPTTTSASATHSHSVPSTGGPSSTAQAVIGWMGGSACATGYCVDYVTKSYFASSSHGHSIGDTGSSAAWHSHTQGITGSAGSHAHTISSHAISLTYLRDIHLSVGTSDTEPVHDTTINGVAAHPHTGVAEPAHNDHSYPAEPAHNDHSYPAEPAHSDHVIQTEPGADVDLTLGIVETPGGTVMQLTVNGEEVISIDGDGTDIVITGYCNTGANTVELYPIVGSNTKGGATLEGRGIVFIEASKF